MGEITEVRSFVLIGRFMKEWAIVELGIDRVVSGALGLNDPQSFIVSRELGTRAKVTLIKKMISTVPKYNDDSKIFKKVIGELDNLLKDRNIVAHHNFFPSKDGARMDFVGALISEGKPDLFVDSWTVQDFLDRFKRMHDLVGELEELRKILKNTTSVLNLASVLSGTQPSIFTMEFSPEKD